MYRLLKITEEQKAFKYAKNKADELFEKEGINPFANQQEYNVTLSQFVDDYFDIKDKKRI